MLLKENLFHLLKTAPDAVILCALSLSTSAPEWSDIDRDFHFTAIEMTDHSFFGLWPKELWISPLIMVWIEKWGIMSLLTCMPPFLLPTQLPSPCHQCKRFTWKLIPRATASSRCSLNSTLGCTSGGYFLVLRGLRVTWTCHRICCWPGMTWGTHKANFILTRLFLSKCRC